MAKKSGKVAKKTPIKVPLKGTPPETPEVLIRRSVLARRPSCLRRMQASAKRVPPIRKSRSQGLVSGIEASHMDELNLSQAQDESAAMETEHDVFDTAVEFEEVGSNDAIGDISASSSVGSVTDLLAQKLRKEQESRRNMQLLNDSMVPLNPRSPTRANDTTTGANSSSSRRTLERTLESYHEFANGRQFVPYAQERVVDIPPPMTPVIRHRLNSEDASLLFASTVDSELDARAQEQATPATTRRKIEGPSPFQRDLRVQRTLERSMEAPTALNLSSDSSTDSEGDYDRCPSPARILAEERILVRPELGPWRTQSIYDDEERCYFLCVPGGRPVSLNDRENTIAPKGIFYDPTPFPNKYINSKAEKYLSILEDIHEEQQNNLLSLETELESGEWGIFLEYGTGSLPLCNIEAYGINRVEQV